MAFTLGPIPEWQFTDLTGKLAVGAGMFVYDAANHDVKLTIYQDVAGTAPWSNPIIFNGIGQNGPFYWADNQAYYIEFRKGPNPTPSSQLIWSINNYTPGTGGGSPVITVNQDLENYINNAQFRIQYPVVAGPLPDTEFRIAPDNWFFRKNTDTADDEYSFEELNGTPGATLPDPNALYWLKYTVNGPAPTGELYKLWGYRYQDVRTFQNQEITVSFMVRGNGNMIGTADLVTVQNFGTGGIPSAEIILDQLAFAVTGDWVPINHTFTIASLTGKVIGDNGDDYFEVALQPKLNTTGDFEFINLQVQKDNISSPAFIYQTYLDTEAEMQQKVAVSATDQLPQFLEQKVVAGNGIVITKQTTDNIETLEFASGGATQFEFGRHTGGLLVTGAYTGTGLIPIAACNFIVSATITPTSASSVLEIDGIIQSITQAVGSSGIQYVVGCICRSTDSSMRSANRQYAFTRFAGVADVDFQTSGTVSVKHIETSGTTSPITYQLRITSSAGSSATINSPSYGSSSAATITVTEHI